MPEALLALAFAYVWVGILEAIDRFERPIGLPEYETAEPEFAAAPSFRRTVRTILFFPFIRATPWSFLRAVLKVLLHAGVVLTGALALTLLFDRIILGLAVIGLAVCLVAFFYILTSTTRVT